MCRPLTTAQSKRAQCLVGFLITPVACARPHAFTHSRTPRSLGSRHATGPATGGVEGNSQDIRRAQHMELMYSAGAPGSDKGMAAQAASASPSGRAGPAGDIRQEIVALYTSGHAPAPRRCPRRVRYWDKRGEHAVANGVRRGGGAEAAEVSGARGRSKGPEEGGCKRDAADRMMERVRLAKLRRAKSCSSRS